MTSRRNIARARPWFPEEDIRRVLGMIEGALRSGALTMGPLVAELERAFAERHHVAHAVAVATGTAAIEIGLAALDLRGREVIVPSETFVATANAVLRVGGRPVFAEIRSDTLCLDVDDVARRIGSKTAGVLVVHMAGLVQPDIEALARLCADHDLFLAEDAAHAHGAVAHGRHAGSIGRFGAFSFYPTKLMTTGEGGMLTTNDAALADFARSYRNHGANLEGSDYVRVATNLRMPEINAALGIVQLARLDEFIAKRRHVADVYRARLDGAPGLALLPSHPGVTEVFWNYLVMLEEGVDRGALAKRLGAEFGVPVAWPYDPPCHLQPVFMRELGTRRGDLPVTERALARHLALPMHAALSDEDVEHVARSLRVCLGART